MDGLNSLGDGLVDSLTRMLPATADATAKIISAYQGQTGRTLSAAEQAALQAQIDAQNRSKLSSYLIIGGVAVAGIALLLYLKKRKS
jgi:LPXTG-motif cell wall-anchored protein